MKKVLVTGARGFIGRHCLPLLVSRGYEVHAVSSQGPLESGPPEVSWHTLDLLAPGDPAQLIYKVTPDALLHLAWYSVPGKFWEARENLEWVRASLELLSSFAQQGGKRVVVAGSCAVYDSNAGECIENVTPLLPKSLYGTSKLKLEELLHLSSKNSGISSACGRIFFLYGPHEHPARLVAYTIRSLLRGDVAQCSDGTQSLDFIHVEDAASAFAALLAGEVQGPVNIGSGNAIRLRSVLEEIGRQTGRMELIRFGDRAAGSVPENFWANTQRLIEEVGWAPRYNLAKGIEETIRWWRTVIETAAREPVRGEME
jgi:nucleoside-diphosphate-sugar epimerase